MTVLAMSHGELSRFDTLMRVERRELRVADAAALSGSSAGRFSGCSTDRVPLYHET